MSTDLNALDAAAAGILRDNDRGGFTVPTARLYPYQWNWDSAFCALGFARFDRDRAWRELETLFEGQWRDGMVPHIIFRRDDPDYFPGPAVWQAGEALPTTGHSQPPVVASILLQLARASDDDLQRAAPLFEPLLRWHRWFHRYRDPLDTGAACVIHPWESGRDNCPDWDDALEGVDVDPDIGDYERQDTKHIDPSERPSKLQYDRYVTIVKFGRDRGWDPAAVAAECPFLVADPGVHFILLRADRDLLALAEMLGRSADETAEIGAWIERGVAGSDYLWNDAIGAFCARDAHTGRFSPALSNASFLAFYADAGSAAQRRSLLDHFNRIAAQVRFMMPSWDPGDSGRFEPQRYWRGPIWPQMNYVISKGLYECGERDAAEKIRTDMSVLIQQSGFYECFNPLSGDGCVGNHFSWTAAIWLAWASPTAAAADA